MSLYTKFHAKLFAPKKMFSEEDAKIFFEAIENPPEPSQLPRPKRRGLSRILDDKLKLDAKKFKDTRDL